MRIGYTDQRAARVPAAQRWDLRLAKARLWEEYIQEKKPAAYQLEDEKHMSPEFNSFIGFPVRTMRPGQETLGMSHRIMERRLPNFTALELHERKDAPYSQNLKFGKLLYDETIHGVSQPYTYSAFKQMQKAKRNDRKLTQNRFKVLCGSGVKNPPAGLELIPDPVEEDKDDKKKK